MKASRSLWIVALAAFAWAPTEVAAASPSSDPAAVVEAKRELKDAVDRGDYAAAAKARARFAALAAADPDAPLLHYWVAVADWRAASMQMRPGLRDKKKIKLHCQGGIAAAERALELDPGFAEAIAVKLGLQGLSISVGGPLAGMTLGPRMETDMQRALALAPDNPRVLFSDGMNTFHKPAFVGGSAEKALARFRQAIERFETEQVTDPAGPDWGRDDAHIWAGQAAMKLEDYAAARDYFARALELNPSCGWVRHALLPAAERALAKASATKSGS
jgi:tetratricopeptide (TPR) repeat protein